jgi:FtsZ-binding cell division protein ZapB
MEDITEISSPRFDTLPSLDVDDADLLEVLLTDDIDNNVNTIPSSSSLDLKIEETKINDLDLMRLATPGSMCMPQDTLQDQGSGVVSNVKVEEDLDDLSKIKDPNELKKQRRLIRNRMSAQLHRERKKAYIDKLEAEVKQRDGTIGVLGSRVQELETENQKLRQLLSQCESCQSKVNFKRIEDNAFDIGFTTHEESCESDASSDDMSRSLPTLGKRPATSTPSTTTSKTARLAPGTLLASLACLFLFKSSYLDMSSMSSGLGVSPSLIQQDEPTPPRLGRVLFSVEEDNEFISVGEDKVIEKNSGNVEKEEKEDRFQSDPSLALVASPPQGQLTSSSSPSIPVKPIPVKSDTSINNKSYFFCPTTFQSSSGGWPRPLNETEKTILTSNQKQYKRRRLRARPKVDNGDRLNNGPPSTLQHQLQHQGDAGSLVVRDPLTKPLLGAPHSSQSYDHDEEEFRQLTLIVPSSSLEGMGELETQSNWLEIDCRMQSARFIDFK